MAKLAIDWGFRNDQLTMEATQMAGNMREAVKAGADLLKTYTANEGNRLMNGRYHTGKTVGSLVVKGPRKAKDGYAATLTYEGNHKSKTRNAEVAFYNEYGVKGRPARPFNRNAAEQNEDKIIQRMQDILDK